MQNSMNVEYRYKPITNFVGNDYVILHIYYNKTRENSSVYTETERINFIVALNEELARKNLPIWEDVIKDYLEKGEWQKAIESINTDADEEEAAKKHIRKAQLYIINFQFSEAELHYKKASVLFPSYSNNCAIADFYYGLNRFSEAIEYYTLCLNLATLPKERAIVLNRMGDMQRKNNSYPEAEKALKEALKIFRALAEENPKAYFPDMARTLNGLSMFYQDRVPNKELSIKYVDKAIEVLGKCNDTPFVRKQIEIAKKVIEEWNNK